VNRTTRIRRLTALKSATPLKRTGGIARTTPLRTTGGVATARVPLKPVSDKRRAENRERSAMADRLWPDRQEGTVMCGCGRPECNRRADDLHEPLSRARGGSITDEANARPLSRECHDEITFSPERELGWAYDAGLLVHSWDAEGSGAA
jgi:hypothetical protein